VNLYNPVTTFSTALAGGAVGGPGTFGVPTFANTAGLGAVTQSIQDPRIMQFALKYIF
jgi:hypothetical protein